MDYGGDLQVIHQGLISMVLYFQKATFEHGARVVFLFCFVYTGNLYDMNFLFRSKIKSKTVLRSQKIMSNSCHYYAHHAQTFIFFIYILTGLSTNTSVLSVSLSFWGNSLRRTLSPISRMGGRLGFGGF